MQCVRASAVSTFMYTDSVTPPASHTNMESWREGAPCRRSLHCIIELPLPCIRGIASLAIFFSSGFTCMRCGGNGERRHLTRGFHSPSGAFPGTGAYRGRPTGAIATPETRNKLFSIGWLLATTTRLIPSSTYASPSLCVCVCVCARADAMDKAPAAAAANKVGNPPAATAANNVASRPAAVLQVVVIAPAANVIVNPPANVVVNPPAEAASARGAAEVMLLIVSLFIVVIGVVLLLNWCL
ncbi:hypothetical protein ACQJBY_061328 [Aegilops geniculata]